MKVYDSRHQASFATTPDMEGKDIKKIFTAETQRSQGLIRAGMI